MSKLSKEVIFVAMVMATYLNGHALAQMRPCELMDYLLNSTKNPPKKPKNRQTVTPVPPPLSISAFSAGHPRTTVDLTGHNSRLWLTRPDGERKKKQYTGLQVSQPPRKKKKLHKSFC